MTVRDQAEEFESQSGVLVLPPRSTGDTWRVVEVDWNVFDSLTADTDAGHTSGYESASKALHDAFDVLTIQAEGRIPAMHEQVQESVRDFVRTLEGRGYDRQAAVKVLLDMVDRNASDPPKGVPTDRPKRR